jgi:hypothetical protein
MEDKFVVMAHAIRMDKQACPKVIHHVLCSAKDLPVGFLLLLLGYELVSHAWPDNSVNASIVWHNLLQQCPSQ